MDFENLLSKKDNVNFIFKMKCFFKYKILNFKLFANNSFDIITYLQKKYYEKRNDELKNEQNNLNRKLKNYSFESKISKYADYSNGYI